MLDLLRRKKRLKYMLWLVIIALGLSMLLFFVPGGNMQNAESDSYAAKVDGEPILAKDLSEAYKRTLDRYTNNGRNQIDPETLKSLGLSRQVLNGLISAKVIEIVAKRLGIEVSEPEVQNAIKAYPYFQEQGQFIGVERYKQLLDANNISIDDFEKQTRLSQLMGKVQAIITDSLEVSDLELRDEFAHANLQTVTDYVVLNKDEFKKRVKPSESDLHAYFDSHKDAYKISERRKAQYLLVRADLLKPTVQANEDEIGEEWAKIPHTETLQAAHILFKVKDPSKEAEVKAKAESVLKQAQDGAPFAGLAKKYSDDIATAKDGGVLGPLQKGQKAKEFDTAAFALQTGQLSGLVRTSEGFHIIKCLNHIVPTLEGNRATLVELVKMKKAQDVAKQKAEQAENMALKNNDLAAIAKQIGLGAEIKETTLFKRDDNPYDLGITQELRDQVFELKQINAIGKTVQHPQGYAVPKLIETQLPKPGEFALSKDQVEKDYVEAKAKELVQIDSKKLSDEAGKQKSLEKAAKSLGLSVKTSKPFNAAGTPGEDIGANPQFVQTASALPIDAVSAPIPMLDNYAVFQVKSRTPFDESAFQKQKSSLREGVLRSKQEPYFQEYVTNMAEKLEKDGKIQINKRVLDQIAASR